MTVDRRSALMAFAALALVLVLGLVGYRTLSARAAAQPVEKTAASPAASEDDDELLLADHDARVYTALGEPVTLSELADGRPFVVNFWATWCPYCVDELTDFQRIHDDYADRVSFAFVDVADGRRETVEGALAWLEDNGYDELPVYFDTELSASAEFGAWSLPTTVVISADGEILTVTAGAIDPVLLRGALETLV